MDKRNKKLRVKKETLKLLTSESLEGMAGGVIDTDLWDDTCLIVCTMYNCGYSYRNCITTQA